jgi:heptaprenyl diphosphate synthase
MKRFDALRMRRREIYEGLFSARALCIAGFLIMPSLLFNPATIFRVVQFFFFWFLAWLSGKKNNPFITLLVIFGIVAFNLIIPYGRVLYSIGIFKITAGALMAGIHRAVTLEGLIMLSRVTIRRDLRIPGAFGELVGECFRIFAQIMDSKQRITRKNLISGIDRLMLGLGGEGAALNTGQTAPAPASKTSPLGMALLVLTVLLSWLPPVFWMFLRLGQR